MVVNFFVSFYLFSNDSENLVTVAKRASTIYEREMCFSSITAQWEGHRDVACTALSRDENQQQTQPT